MNSEVNSLGSHLSEELNVTTVISALKLGKSVTHELKVKLWYIRTVGSS